MHKILTIILNFYSLKHKLLLFFFIFTANRLLFHIFLNIKTEILINKTHNVSSKP